MPFRKNNLNRLGNTVSVTIPRDEQGYVGRECPEPECEGYFKVKPGTGLTGVDLCHCPYCGHSGSNDTFFTKDQIEYAKSVAVRQFVDALHRDLKTLEFEHKPSGPFGIGLSLKVQPGAPVPIKRLREQALETHGKCEGCTLEYAVFGVFAYCPDCRSHNSLQILRQNLALIQKQIELAGTIEDLALKGHLIEDALENCISSFDGFARESCRVRAGASGDPTSAETLSFQNLPRVANRLRNLFGIAFDKTLASEQWGRAHLLFMRRHLIAHKSGVIDTQYLEETGEPASLAGKRIRVSPEDVTELLALIESLGTGLLALLPAA